MDTKLINSQLLSRKDVKVWFFHEGAEYRGEATLVAENGLVFRIKQEPPKTADPLSFWSDLRSLFKNKTLTLELSSPRTKKELRVQAMSAEANPKKNTLTVTGVFLTPVDAPWVKLLLEPVVTQIPKRT